jgi:YbbR domain-containing protein
MKKLFFENIGLKIAAVLLSIALWVFVTSRGQSEISVDVPLEFQNIPAGLEIVNRTVKTVGLTVKGQDRFVKNIRPSDIGVSVDLSKAKKGENVFYIHRADIKLPHSASVTSIEPSNVKVIMGETIAKTVKVLPLITGAPERGYYVKSVEVTPRTVVVEGIKSEVARIKTVRTEPLDVTGLDETVTQDVRLDLGGRNVRSRTADVTVSVVIGGGEK